MSKTLIAAAFVLLMGAAAVWAAAGGWPSHQIIPQPTSAYVPPAPASGGSTVITSTPQSCAQNIAQCPAP